MCLLQIRGVLTRIALWIIIGMSACWPYISVQAAEESPITEEVLNRAADYVREQLQKSDVVGGAMGIVYRDQLIFSEGFGTADRGLRNTPAADTLYYTASITKTLTATAIYQLHAAGKLDIDQPVHTYLPWFQFQDREASEQITLRHLLTHSAGGVGSFDTDGLLFQDEAARSSLEKYVRLFQSIAIREQPGTSGAYCNGCYDVLGLVIEYVTGVSYYDYVRENIFEPLGMEDTVFGHELERYPESRLAKEYGWFFTRKMHIRRSYEEFGQAQDPDGGAYSTVEDLGKYLAYQLGYLGADWLPAELIKDSRTAYVATESGDAAYTASGFETKLLHGTQIFYKTGDGVGSSSIILFMPAHELGIILFIGEMHPEITLPIAEGIASILLGHVPAEVGMHVTFGMVIGIISLVLVSVSTFLIAMLLIRLVYRLLYAKNLLSTICGLVSSAIASGLFWYLALLVRPSAAGSYGYPYDAAIGLGMITVATSLWTVYYILVILMRKYVHPQQDHDRWAGT